MELAEYLKTLPSEAAREAFAGRCQTTLGYLRRVMYSADRRFSADLCIDIERESVGHVTCEKLRDDVDWAYLRNPRKRAA